MLNIRALNRKKNHLLRHLKTQIIKLLVDHKKRQPIIRSDIQHLLFIRDDNKLGDLILATAAFKAAKQAGYQVSVWVNPATAELIQHNSYIDQVIIEPKGIVQKLQRARALNQQKVDLTIDISDDLKATKLLIISQIKARYCLGCERDNYQLYDISIAKQDYLGQHMLYRYRLLFNFLGHPNIPLNYAVTPDKEAESTVKTLLKSFSGPIWVINPFAASHHRELKQQQLQQLIQKIEQEYPQITLFLIGTSQKLTQLPVLSAKVQRLPQNSLMTTIALIKQADLVISPDTAIVHLAAAFNKPLVALYRAERRTHQAHEIPNSLLWGPNNPAATILYTTEPEADIHTLSVEQIYRAVQTKYYSTLNATSNRSVHSVTVQN